MEIVDRDWQTYQDPTGFSLRHPPGWEACRHATGAAFVISPDQRAFVLLQEMSTLGGAMPVNMVQQGAFPGAAILQQAQAGQLAKDNNGRLSCYVKFRFPDNAPGLALVACEPFSSLVWLVSVCAAREPMGLQNAASLLWWITRSYRRLPNATFAGSAPVAPRADGEPPRPPAINLGDDFLGKTVAYAPMPAGPAPVATQPQTAPPPVVQPAPPVRPAPPAPSPALAYDRFTEPQMGTFQIDVPRGWQVRGGFLHPGLGDRRLFVEAHSPQGVSVFLGDPNFPQIFYHNPMVWGENFIPYPQGCTFLNLAASGKKLAQYYLKNVAPQRLGPIKTVSERDRRDLAEASKRRYPHLAAMSVTAYEVSLRAGNRSGRCVAMANGNKGAIFGDNWIGNVTVWLAPQGLEAVAEQVAKHMEESFAITPQLNQIVMRDEAMIAGNGHAAVVNQQQWFNGQQIAHRTQEQIGDVIVQSWDHTQRVNDQIFQHASDAMRGHERLYDETMGREYTAAAGSNYYWIDNTSGAVIGTNTDTPPDYQRDYRLLKKL